MINKRISKITMMASLLLAGIVNAQEFYTCVPKKSWWSDVIKESVKSGISEEKKEQWVLQRSERLYNNTLEPDIATSTYVVWSGLLHGIYKVLIKNKEDRLLYSKIIKIDKYIDIEFSYVIGRLGKGGYSLDTILNYYNFKETYFNSKHFNSFYLKKHIKELDYYLFLTMNKDVLFAYNYTQDDTSIIDAVIEIYKKNDD